MATLTNLFDLQEQICYVQCSFCTTILLVNVPVSSLSTVVTVKCGHCTGLLSVNMLKAFSLPFHLLAALNQNPQEVEQESQEGDLKPMDMWSSTVASPDHDQEAEEEKDEVVAVDDDICISDHSVLKPPAKKKRAPSAYNCFIKEEIRRLKAINPFMTHKQAFSTAAKNWAHFPNSVQQEGEDDADDDDNEKNLLKEVEAEDSEEMRLSDVNKKPCSKTYQ